MYRRIVRKRAQRTLDRLPTRDFEAIKAAIDDLANNPRPRGMVKIRSREGTWRIRQGDYRIVYTIDDDQKIITVLDIDHRKQVYRWL